jgi:hypothetical protein
MQLHSRTLKFAAPLALVLVLVLAATSPAVAAKRAASAGTLLIGQIVTETNPTTPGSKNT